MNRNWIGRLVRIVLLLCIGCSDYIREMGIFSGYDNSVTMAYEVAGDIEETRSVAASSRECALHDAYLFFFEQDGSEFILVAHTKVTQIQQETKKIAFEIPESIKPQDGLAPKKYKILIAGNWEAYLPAGSSYDSDEFQNWIENQNLMGRTPYNVREVLYAANQERIISDESHFLPMWGEYHEDGSDSERVMTLKKNDQGQYALGGIFKFWRAVSRIDLVNEAGSALNVKYVGVWNYRTKGYLYVEGKLFGKEDIRTYTGEAFNPNSYESNEDFRKIYIHSGLRDTSTETVDGTVKPLKQELKESIYVFPNICTTSIDGDTRTTCLVIGGYYNDGTNYSGKISWYRMNVCNYEDSQNLRRNHLYRATITGVRKEGDDDDKKAYDNQNPDIDYEVFEKWEDDDNCFVSNSIGEWIKVSKNKLLFPGTYVDLVDDQNNPATQFSPQTIHVQTSKGLPWEWVKVDGADHDSYSKFTDNPIPAENKITVVPKDVNNANTLNMAYYAVRLSSNPDLQVEIYVEQGSTQDAIYYLKANGKSGRYGEQVKGDGEQVCINITTGSNVGAWIADISGLISTWGTGISTGNVVSNYKISGGNGSDLKLRIPGYYDQETPIAAGKYLCVDNDVRKGIDPDKVANIRRKDNSENKSEGLGFGAMIDNNGNITRYYDLKLTYEPKSGTKQELVVRLLQAVGEFPFVLWFNSMPEGWEYNENTKTFTYSKGFERYPGKYPSWFVEESQTLHATLNINSASDLQVKPIHGFDKCNELAISASVHGNWLGINGADSQTDKFFTFWDNNEYGNCATASIFSFVFSNNQTTYSASTYSNPSLKYFSNLNDVRIRPWRMAPDDPEIKGDFVLEGASSRLMTTYHFEIKMTERFRYGDVILTYTENDGTEKFLLVSDRYVGCPTKGESPVAPDYSPYNSQIIYNTLYHRAQLTQAEINEKMVGAGFYQNVANLTTVNPMTIEDLQDKWLDLANKGSVSWKHINTWQFSPFYSEEYANRWQRISDGRMLELFVNDKQGEDYELPNLRLCNAKLRHFLISDEKYSPLDGSLLCCWLPVIPKTTNGGSNTYARGNTANYNCGIPIGQDDNNKQTKLLMLGGAVTSVWNWANYACNYCERLVLPLSKEEADIFKEYYLNSPGCKITDRAKYEECKSKLNSASKPEASAVKAKAKRR